MNTRTNEMYSKHTRAHTDRQRTVVGSSAQLFECECARIISKITHKLTHARIHIHTHTQINTRTEGTHASYCVHFFPITKRTTTKIHQQQHIRTRQK